MIGNDAFYVFGAAIVNFDVNFVENSEKFMIFLGSAYLKD